MTRSILLAVCIVGIFGGRAAAQLPGYTPLSSATYVDMGGNYRLQVGSPFYRPASASAIYYSPGYSPAYYRTLSYPALGPVNMPAYQQTYYRPGYYYYYRSFR